MAPLDQDEIEKQLALAEVMEHAVRETRAVVAAKPMRSYRWRPIIIGGTAIASVVFAAFTFVVRPAFIFGPNPASVPAVRRDADTRLAMYLIAQRVIGYWAENRRFPESLDLLGEQWDGIAYRVVNDSVFELRAQPQGRPPIVLRSDEKIDPFIAQSVTLIRRRRQ